MGLNHLNQRRQAIRSIRWFIQDTVCVHDLRSPTLGLLTIAYESDERKR